MPLTASCQPTRICYFEVRDEDGVDDPGWYVLFDESVYLGPHPTRDDACAFTAEVLSESGSIDVLLSRLAFHSQSTKAALRSALRTLTKDSCA